MSEYGIIEIDGIKPYNAAPASNARGLPVRVIGTVPISEDPLVLPATYGAYKHNLVCDTAGATDVFTISGASDNSKIVRIIEIRVSGYRNSNSVINLHIIKRSSLNTGGTSTTPSITPYDSRNPTAKAVVKAYSANPTGLGAQVGSGVIDAWFSLNNNNSQNIAEQVYRFDSSFCQPLTLVNSNEMIAVNMVGAVMNGNNWCMSLKWTESDT